MGDSNISIFSMNCRGLRDSKKRLDVFHYIREKNCSIYCLQDTHFLGSECSIIRSQWGYDVYNSCGTSNSRGVCILFNNNFEFEVLSEKHDHEGNFLQVDIRVEKKFVISLLSIYGPNKDDPNFYKNIANILENNQNSDFTVICGDWNLIQDFHLDSNNYVNINNPNARSEVLNMASKFDLVDPWRLANPKSKMFTWQKRNPVKKGRLDFFLVSNELLNLIECSKIEPGYRTDHSAIVLKLRLSNFKRGPGLWRFNTSLLEDKDYVDLIKNIIHKTKIEYATFPYDKENIHKISDNELQFIIDDSQFLEMLLLNIRSQTISFCKQKKKRSNIRIKSLERQLSFLHLIKQNTQSSIFDEIYDELTTELENIRRQIMKGVQIRTRVRWIEHGEKPTKYFANLEKRNFVNKNVTKLFGQGGEIITDQSKLLLEISNFYKSLYTSKDDHLDNADLENMIKHNDVPKLSNEARLYFDKLIDSKEVLNVLKNMKNNKSPGPDGLPAEFFKFFWKDISAFLVRSFNNSYLKGFLPISQNQGAISILPKGNKPRELLTNWRPISLLNTSYKILSSCIAHRLKSVVNVLCHKDQKGFIKGRYIGENTRNIYDLLQSTEENNIPGLLVLIDFEKAFDSISWKFIYKTLEFFRFGKFFIDWIKLLNSNVKLCVLQHGTTSEYFSVGRGCRQGDPVSPYLFILCVEILGILFRQNNEIKGININKKVYKILQYADDTAIFIDGSERSLKNSLELLDQFSKFSGLKPNLQKTHCVWIGSMKFSDRKLCSEYNLSWKRDSFSMLGIDFSMNLSEMVELNFSKKLLEIEKTFADWSRRQLTVLGKITVVKSFILSKLIHLFIVLPTPSSDFLLRLEKMCFKFIWGGKNDKIKRSILIQDYDLGGCKMIHIKSFIKSLKFTWLKKLVFSSDEMWLSILYENDIFRSHGNFLHFGNKFFELCSRSIKNYFWKDIFAIYNDYISNVSRETEKLPYEPLWYNSGILVDKKYVYYKSWYKRNIVYVYDLLGDDGLLLTYNSFCTKFGFAPPFTEFYGIRKSVQMFFREAKNRTFSVLLPNVPKFLADILFFEKPHKKIYRDFVKKQYCKPSFESKWETKLNFAPSQEWWRKIHLNSVNFTIDTKLRWFQIRLSHHLISTNSFLHKIGVKNSYLCSFCGKENEDLIHLYWLCDFTKTFWNSVDFWYSQKYNISLNLNNFDVLFGKQDAKPVLNLFLTLAKYHIYTSRLQNSLPNLEVFKKSVQEYFLVEKFIFSKNLDDEFFLERWAPLSLLL